LPERIPLRWTIGPTSEIPSVEGEFEVGIDDFLDECVKINRFIVDKNRLPSFAEIGGRKIGLGGFLKAMAEVLLRIREGMKGGKIRIREAESYPAIADVLSLPHYEGTWLYSPSFKGENIIKMAKLQTWSAKPAM